MRSLFIAFALATAPALFAIGSGTPQGEYQPPKPPKLFDETVPPAPLPTKYGSSPFLGLGLDVGQSRSIDGEAPLTALFGDFRAGYISAIGSWNHVEFGGEVKIGQLGHADADLFTPFTGTARVGYGYTINQALRGVFYLGGGVSLVNFEDSTNGVVTKATDMTVGHTFKGGYALEFPMGDSLLGDAGFYWSYYSYLIKDVETAGISRTINKRIALNVPSVQLSVKWRL